MDMKQQGIIQLLMKLIPLNELTPDNFDQVVRTVIVKSIPAGKFLFHRGVKSPKAVYLLEGELSLIDKSNNVKHIKGGSKESCHALNPQQYTAMAKNEITFALIDKRLLDVLITWNQNANYMVSELEGQTSDDAGENDWMTTILTLQIFHKIPPANIQAMFMRMEEVAVKKGQVIIKQGEQGDYYYAIKQGRCEVICNTPQTGNVDKVIARLEQGQGFGEDALVSDSPRNATIKMLTDGSLMRMAKTDFEALLKAPVLNTVNYQQAQQMVGNKAALWLDVRLQSESRQNAITGSINIPLYLLRLNAHKLSADRKYIVYCDTGRRSASAAFILNEQGFDAYVLEGGMNDYQSQRDAD